MQGERGTVSTELTGRKEKGRRYRDEEMEIKTEAKSRHSQRQKQKDGDLRSIKAGTAREETGTGWGKSQMERKGWGGSRKA